MPRPLQCQYFEAQSHTPFDCCVRFVVVVTFHAATLATRRTLLPTWAGLAPAGSRQLRLAHHHLLLAGLPAHLCENAQEPTRRRILFTIVLFPTAATALFLFRLTKSRRTFYVQIECLCFHAASTLSRPSWGCIRDISPRAYANP